MASSSEQSSSPEDSLVDVPVVNYPYKTIKKMIKSTFKQGKVGKGADAKDLNYSRILVTGIERIENETLLQEYEGFRDKLRKKHPEGCVEITIRQLEEERRIVDLNEIYLFHGTRISAATSIVRQGFKLPVGGRKKLYGPGIYFAEKFTKADQYCDRKIHRARNGTELRLLLCRVLMGDTLQCSRKHALKCQRPPCKKCKRKHCRHGWENRYDSVLGKGPGLRFREFVVYDEKQCYPQFLIKYKRIT